MYSLEVPKNQGDTLFSNMIAAYEDMPERLINIIDGKYQVMVYRGHSYFIKTDYMGGTKAYICKSKKKLITN